MTPEIIGFIGIAVMLVLMFARMWVALAMAFVGFAGIIALQGLPQALQIAGSVPYTFIFKYVLTTVPMYVLMGNIIAESGIGSDLFFTANKWLGGQRGGLAIATNFSCAFLGAITGVSSVALVTMGKIALPEMRKRGYADSLSTGCIAASGTLAFLIPPSIPFILYGVITEQSIGKLYMAGVLPGILLAFLFALVIVIITSIAPSMGPKGDKSNFKEKLVSLKGVWMTIILFLVVIGGIYSGIFTPTEAGAFGAFGALIISLISRRLNRQNFVRLLVDSSLMTSMVLLLLMGVSIFIRFISISKIPFLLSGFITGLSVSPIIILICIVCLYIILGMFTDIISSVLLTVPILYPIIISQGFDPIWFGVLLVALVELGVITPPVGMDVFILGGLTNVSVGTIFRGVAPFLIAIIVLIALLIIFPQIALFLPGTM